MFAGLGVMLLLTPVNLITTSKVQTYQKTMMEFKDSRIKLMTEILNGIKVRDILEILNGIKVRDILEILTGTKVRNTE
ncbi:hypothetical protein DPMN_120325 [Dreissena polymorpha]|uniref:Uncharacterized protein n=1 Tax=Dreissena polymorpha TaxID=45954 RepID=A0A9D4GKM4_DREPO|nr:hypothetical protein DPMN_120325 [Dreissena polymorpha]